MPIGFGNAAGALSGAGGGLMRAGKAVGQAGAAASPGLPSVRKFKKMNEIATEHHAQRTQHLVDAAQKAREGGSMHVELETGHGRISVAGPMLDKAYNPSAEEHGHPGAGFTQTHGYSGDAAAAQPVKVISISSIPNGRSSVATNSSAKPVQATRVQPLALESGKATDLGMQSGVRPMSHVETGPKFVAGPAGVVKQGSFMDQPEKAQPEIPAKLKDKSGAIPTRDSASKGKLKGPTLKADADSGMVSRSNKPAYEAKLDAQEAAHLATRKKSAKDDK